MFLVMFFTKALSSFNLFYGFSFLFIAHAMDPNPKPSIQVTNAASQSSIHDLHPKPSIRSLKKDLIQLNIVLNPDLPPQDAVRLLSTSREFRDLGREVKEQLKAKYFSPFQPLLDSLDSKDGLSHEAIRKLISNQKILVQILLDQINWQELGWIESTLTEKTVTDLEKSKVFLGALSAKILTDVALLHHPVDDLALFIAQEEAEKKLRDTPIDLLDPDWYAYSQDKNRYLRRQVNPFFDSKRYPLRALYHSGRFIMMLGMV